MTHSADWCWWCVSLPSPAILQNILPHDQIYISFVYILLQVCIFQPAFLSLHFSDPTRLHHMAVLYTEQQHSQWERDKESASARCVTQVNQPAAFQRSGAFALLATTLPAAANQSEQSCAALSTNQRTAAAHVTRNEYGLMRELLCWRYSERLG